MKTALIAALLTGFSVMPVFAADRDSNQQGQRDSFEQQKTEILQHIEQKIANIQAEKTCVKAAASYDDLKACRDKFRGERKGVRQDRKGN